MTDWTVKIGEFRGEYSFLSNFYRHPMMYGDLAYPTSEHAFQAQKARDRYAQVLVSQCSSPGIAKKLGRKIPLRDDWDQVKDDIMLEILRVKFSDPGLAQQLVDTGDAYLEEGNTWGDTYWGVCRDVGSNVLGKLLMKVRFELQGYEFQVTYRD